MNEIGGYFLFPLFYLTMTSGLPPGLTRNSVDNVLAPTTLTSSPSSSLPASNLTTTLLFNHLQNVSTTIESMTMQQQKQYHHDDESTDSAAAADNAVAPTPAPVPAIAASDWMDKDKNSNHGDGRGGRGGGGVTNSIDTSSNGTTSTSLHQQHNHHQQHEQQHHDDEMHHNNTDTPLIAPLIQNITKVPLRGKCNNTNQCFGNFVECSVSVCKCSPGYLPRMDNGDLCGEASLHHVEIPQADPTMIGVVIGLCLMSITLCVVLRLFAKARFRENRTIFNTPNPRLMNVSLLKGSKLLRGNSAPRSRRGSTASARSGAEPGTPTSPMADPMVAHGQDNGYGNNFPLAGSSSRPNKPMRQVSSDAGAGGGDNTPNTNRPASAINKQKFRHQDSVASNV